MLTASGGAPQNAHIKPPSPRRLPADGLPLLRPSNRDTLGSFGQPSISRHKLTTEDSGVMALWKLDPVHTRAHFSARHMMLATVRGRFDSVRGTLTFDPVSPAESSVEAVIETASLTTGVTERDKQLR